MNCFIQFLFPNFCLQCSVRLPHYRDLFCSSCLEELSLLPLEQIQTLRRRGHLAAFEYEGPAACLVRALKFGGRSELAKIAASFMAVQLLSSNWPLPDLLVPVPQSLTHRLLRGYNPSLLLAQALSRLINRPVQELLKRQGWEFSQTGRSEEQRKMLDQESFAWKKRESIADLHLLLIDDVMTTGTTLEHCKRRLQEGFPKRIDTLVLCLTTF